MHRYLLAPLLLFLTGCPASMVAHEVRLVGAPNQYIEVDFSQMPDKVERFDATTKKPLLGPGLVRITETYHLGASGQPVRIVVVPIEPTEPSHAEDIEQERSKNELMHVQGHFLNIQPTGKRHQSYLFTFKIEYQLGGPYTKLVEQDTAVTFELYHDFGGRDLILSIQGDDPADERLRVNLQETVENLPDRPPFQLALWKTSPRPSGHAIVDAELVHSPIVFKGK